MGDIADKRRRRRSRAPALARFTRCDGQVVPCNIIDLSTESISVKTAIKPPVGEFVLIDRMAGRVVCHYASGVRIELVGNSADTRGAISQKSL